MTRTHTWLVAGSLALGAVACNDKETGTGPHTVALSDPLNTSAQAQAVSALFSTPVYFTYVFLSGHFADPIFGRMTQRIRAPVHVPPAQRGPASIPPQLLGTTYVWDPDSAGYVTSSLAGAPSNGIRFILYSLSVVTPAVPLNPIGYADVTNRSTGPATLIGLTLVGTTGAAPVSYADLTIGTTADFGDSIAGYLSDGQTRMDLVATSRGALPEVLSSDEATFVVPSTGVHLSFQRVTSVRGNEQSDTLIFSHNYGITIGAETLVEKGGTVAVLSGTTGTLTGTILATLNDQPLGKLEYVSSGTGLIVTSPSGQPLAPADEAALRALFGAPSTALFELGGLFVLPLVFGGGG